VAPATFPVGTPPITGTDCPSAVKAPVTNACRLAKEAACSWPEALSCASTQATGVSFDPLAALDFPTTNGAVPSAADLTWLAGAIAKA
jgi:hypothetical protein